MTFFERTGTRNDQMPTETLHIYKNEVKATSFEFFATFLKDRLKRNLTCVNKKAIFLDNFPY